MVRSHPQIINAIRKTDLDLLERAEHQARVVTSVPKHKSPRRRIFEWFERG